jgi:glycosyltransferase involved in cell wall biosynthesis
VRAPDVALIAPYPPGGQRHGGSSGVASYTANLAHALAGEGAGVTVVAPTERGEPTVGADGPVRVERRFARGAGAVPAAVRAAQATGAPAVHLQHEVFLYGGPSSVPGLVAGLADLRRRGTASVVTMHHVVDGEAVDRDFTRLHRVAAPAAVARAALGGVRSAIGRLADRVIVHEPAFARAVRSAAVVPHGVEESSSAPSRAEARARLGLERFTALCFGFVAPYKGLETALEAGDLAGDAIEVVVAGGEHPRLRQAGDGYAAALQAAYPKARFTGFVADADVAAWFAGADVALFLYPQPVSSSGALALAFAHGTPPLVSPEMAATTGAPAALAVPRDPAAVAARLHELSADPGELAALRVASREFAADRAWPAVARRHLALYEEVIHADRAPRRRLRATQPG